MTRERFDITSRPDVMRLVNTFYGHVRGDELLGPIFDDVARVDWATHLPRMYDFWESLLFGTATFKGTPLVVHRALARRTPLTRRAFDRWVALFHTTVDDLFEGVVADNAKRSAARIAVIMLHNIAGDEGTD
jgi:hemoglobin